MLIVDGVSDRYTRSPTGRRTGAAPRTRSARSPTSAAVRPSAPRRAHVDRASSSPGGTSRAARWSARRTCRRPPTATRRPSSCSANWPGATGEDRPGRLVRRRTPTSATAAATTRRAEAWRRCATPRTRSAAVERATRTTRCSAARPDLAAHRAAEYAPRTLDLRPRPLRRGPRRRCWGWRAGCAAAPRTATTWWTLARQALAHRAASICRSCGRRTPAQGPGRPSARCPRCGCG